MNSATDSLASWGRRYFTPGGGDAFLYYVVFGRIDTAARLSRSKYRSEGIPSGLNVMSYGRKVHPEVLHSFQEGYLWDELCIADKELAACVSSQDSCIVIRGTIQDPPTLNYHRDTIGLITHFLDVGGVAVYDPLMFRWWSPELWKERIFSTDTPVPRHHTVILVSEDTDSTEWLHTRGLRKYGRPDISIHGVSAGLKEPMIDLCERFIELQAFGGVISEGQEIRMKSLPEGMRCHHGGSVDDPDFNNVHVEITQTSRGEPSARPYGSPAGSPSGQP